MTAFRYSWPAVCGLLLTLISMASLSAEEPGGDFYRGYYLQEQGDLEGALAAYKAALTGDADQAVKRKVMEQLDAMAATVAAGDMARLMPRDTMAYIELAQPAKHLERLANRLGLVGHQHDGDRVLLPIDDGFAIPSDFQISPALMNELKKISGVAVAVTGIDFEKDEPEGIVVIHAGNSDLIRGLIETGIQVVPRQDAIAGCETFCIANEVWFAKCGSLIVGSADRDNIAGVLRRLQGDGDSLADDQDFRKRSQDRETALVFAYLNGPQLMRRLGPRMDDEAAVARIVLGLDHLQHITATVGVTEAGAAAKVTCAYEPGHQSLAYGFVRTVPLKEETLKRIPSGSAVVAALGINPQLGALAGMSHPEHLSGLDLGRELFANIKDIGLFVLPSVSPAADEVPDFGLVVTAHDAAKSEKLWNRLLSLPAELQVEDGIGAEPQTIAGFTARRYQFPDDDVPALFVIRLGDDSLVFGTEAAVSLAAATATGGHASLSTDGGLASVVAQRSPRTSKAVFAHLGRVLKMSTLLDAGADEEVEQLSQVLQNMRVALTSEESPSELTVRLEASGLPLFEDIIKSVVQAQQDEMAVAEY